MSLHAVARVLGDGNAENERNLDQSFLRTRDYETVASNYRSLVLGGRGAGKSAIFRILSNLGAGDPSGAQDVWTVDLSFDDATRRKVERAAADEREDIAALSRQWELAILLQCFELIVERAPTAVKRKKLLKALDGEVVKYLDRDLTRSVTEGRLGALVETAIRVLAKLPFKFVVKAPFLPVSIEPRDPGDSAGSPGGLVDQDRDRAAIIESMYGVVKEGLPSEVRIRVLIDELDVAWQATPSQVASLCGLLSAVMKFKSRLIQLELDEIIAVTLFLREDIYEILKRRGLFDASKYRGHELHLHWTPASLRQMIDHRLSGAGTGSLSFRALFDDAKISAKRLDDHILDWIVPRPRDLLTILSAAVESAIGRNGDTISREDVQAAMNFYSNWRSSVMIEESHHAVTDIEDIVNSFSNGPAQYTPRDLRAHLDQAKRDYGVTATKPRLVGLLIESGFLGVRTGSQRTFIWDVPPGHALGPQEGAGSSDDAWIIHPSLWSKLAINPRLGTTTAKTATAPRRQTTS